VFFAFPDEQMTRKGRTKAARKRKMWKIWQRTGGKQNTGNKQQKVATETIAVTEQMFSNLPRGIRVGGKAKETSGKC